MLNQYRQVSWGSATEEEAKRLIAEAKREDVADGRDWTSVAVTANQPRCRVHVVARGEIVVAGLPLLPLIQEAFDADLSAQLHVSDGQKTSPGDVVATLEGAAADLLTVERTLLNFLGHLSGIATATAAYVTQTSGTRAAIYDTRKTLPGWRCLQKYAVRCGGGTNHRLGLYDAVLIKDNHIALLAEQLGVTLEEAPVRAVEAVRSLAASSPAGLPVTTDANTSATRLGFPLEIEVDSLQQLERVLPALPDIVLLDNMSPHDLRRAVSIRDRLAPGVILEASGRVNLETVREVALSGVDRISVGALTHSVMVADLGLDWLD